MQIKLWSVNLIQHYQTWHLAWNCPMCMTESYFRKFKLHKNGVSACGNSVFRFLLNLKSLLSIKLFKQQVLAILEPTQSSEVSSRLTY